MKFSARYWPWSVALAVLAGLCAPPAPASGPSVVVQMNEPFEIDGEVYRGGRLSLHALRPLSPVATLSELRVDDRSLGLMIARSDGAVPATRNEMIFERRDDGQLVLVSVALRGEPVRRLLPLAGDGAARRRSAPVEAP